MTGTEPRNPLYFLLLLVGVVFVITALAYAVIPVLEQKASEAGQPPPPSEFRDALRRDGWRWLLCEVGLLIVVGIASMMLDRYRSLQTQQGREEPTPPDPGKPPSQAITTLPDPGQIKRKNSHGS